MSDIKPPKVLSLKAATGWLSAQPDGTFEANRQEIGPWEQFEVVPVEGFRLKTAHGRWLDNYGGILAPTPASDACAIFRMIPGPGGAVGLQDIDTGRFLQVDQGDYPAITVLGESLGPWEQFTLPQPSRILAPIQGQLRIANGSFSDDTGPRCVTMIHAGNLFLEYSKDKDKARRTLDLFAARGYSGDRWWTRLRGDWWKSQSGEIGQEITPNYWGLMREWIIEHRDRGLGFHTGAGDLRFIGEKAEDEYIDGMAALATEFPNQFLNFEYVNEARDTDDEDSPYDAKQDMARFLTKCPSILTSLSAYTGHEDTARLGEWTAPWMQFLLVHALRDGRWWDKIRHIFSLVYEGKVRRLAWHGEPWGVGPRVSASTEASKAELTAVVYGMAAAQCLMTGGVWTDFFSPGVILGDERFEDYPQFGVAPRVAAALEAVQKEHGFSWGQLRLMHGGAGRPNVLEIVGGQAGKEARIDQAIDDTRGVFIATAYGDSSFGFRTKWTLKALRALDPVTCEWTDLPTGGGVSFDGRKPCVLLGVRA